jgi:hypothetical protein
MEVDYCSLRRRSIFGLRLRSILFSEVLVLALLAVIIVSGVKATGKEKVVLEKRVDTAATGVRAAGEEEAHHRLRAAVGEHFKFISYC